MRSLCMSFLVSCFSLSYISAEISEDFVQQNFQKLSQGVSCIIVDKQVNIGSKSIINSVVELTSEIAKNNFTEEDKKEIEASLSQFGAQLEIILQYKTKSEKEKQLLSEGLSQLISNVFFLALLQNNIGYYVKNIISALLKIIISVLDDASPGHADLIAVQQALHDALNKHVLCIACKTK